jgi:hypothetical protein
VPVALWIAADKDTHISFPERARNFGQMPLVVADTFPPSGASVPHAKATYVQFLLPDFAPGLEVLKAKLELFHSGKTEDGVTDDITIPVVSNTRDWNPCTLTWDNAPQPFVGREFDIKLRSQAWSGTPTGDPKLLQAVMRQMSSPGSNRGFIVNYPASAPGIEKGFYDDNDRSRTDQNLGKAPRLLLMINIPGGTTTGTFITMPSALPPENDLNTAAPRGTGSILMLIVRPAPGGVWPPAWDVSPN